MKNKIKFLGLILLYLISNIVFVLIQVNNAYCYDSTPIIVLREDDIRSSWRTPFSGLDGKNALQYGMDKNIPISWGVITAQMLNGTTLTASELKNYISVAGGEVISHSNEHKLLNNVQEYINDITTSDTILTNTFGHSYKKDFYQPGIWTDGYVNFNSYSKLYNDVGLAIQNTFYLFRAYVYMPAYSSNFYYNYGGGNAFGLDYIDNNSIDFLSGWFDAVAGESNKVFIVSCHGVMETGDTTQTYTVNADVIKYFMDKASLLRDQGKIRLMGISDAVNASRYFDQSANRLGNSSFEYDFNFWGCKNTLIKNDIVYDGNKSLLLKKRDTEYSTISSGTLSLEPGKYLMSWYQYTPNLSAKATLYLFQRETEKAGEEENRIYIVNGEAYANTHANKWQLMTREIQLQDNKPITDFYLYGGYNYDIYIDNISLKLVEPKGLRFDSITPTSSENNDMVYAEISGNGFVDGVTVKLEKIGSPSISGSNIQVLSSNKIGCTFDLTNINPNIYNVVVKNPDLRKNVLYDGFTVGNAPPTISIGARSASVAQNGPITYTITYGGADNITLAAGNVTLIKTGTADGIVSVTGSGTTTRTVTISGITGDGTLGISIVAGTAYDVDGNYSDAAGPSTKFNVDNTPPTLGISAPSSSLTVIRPIFYKITYGDANSVTLVASDITLNKTGTANGTIVVSGSGITTRTVTISGITGDGTLGISIAAGTASDIVGNNAAAAGPITTFTVDSTAPTFTLSGTLNLLDSNENKSTVKGTVELDGVSYPLILNIDNKFNILNVDVGTCNVRIKASHWLAKAIYDVVVAGDTVMDTITLINGDVVENNEVDFSDINAVRAAYGSALGDENWNERADVDGSGEVDFTDINIVRSNYGEIGD